MVMQRLCRAVRFFRNAALLWRARKAGNLIEIDHADLWRVSIRAKRGATGNVVRIGKMRDGAGTLAVRLCCERSRVEIGEGLAVGGRLSIVLSTGLSKPSNVTVKIGSHTSFESCRILMLNANSSVEIGSGCMFAYDVIVHHTDVHPVYDLATGRIVNTVGTLKIGDRVWVGARATVLKNSVIPDGCIVGWGSVVSGCFARPNVVLAGNPAQVRTPEGKSIRWAGTDPAYYANMV